MEFWELVVAHIALWGNAYLRYRFDRLGRVVGFDGIHPGRVKVARHKESRRKYYVVDGNVDRPLTDDDLPTFPALGMTAFVGLPIRAARRVSGSRWPPRRSAGRCSVQGCSPPGSHRPSSD